MTLLAPQWLHALWAVALLGVLIAAGAAAGRRALARFYGGAIGRAGTPPGKRRRVLRAGAVLLALSALVAALARPAYDPRPREVQRRGRDVLFLIDVSRSMLAADLRPNRLERAKLFVRDAMDVIRGDRVGIVAFAGTAVVKSPLTTDYAFARLALDELGPDSVSRGGTAIGDAIRLAMTQFFPPGAETHETGQFRDIFPITDGEDHESMPVEAARAAGERGVRIIAIGLGSELGGAPVPTGGGRGEFIEHGGKRVESRLDPVTLRAIADASTDGRFLNVGTGNIELDRVYRRLMSGGEARRIEAADAVRYTEAFQWCLAIALGLLLLEPLAGLGRRGP